MKNRRHRPKIIANFAISADGKVSTRQRTPSTFTSPRDKKRLLEIRALGDAILVGRNTVATDTMSMTLPDRSLQAVRRAKGLPAEPLRVIVGGHASLDTRWKVFRTPGARRIVFGTSPMPEARRAKFAPLCDLHVFQHIGDLLGTLRQTYGVRTVICEGGPTLLRSLVEAGALDELYLTIAPIVFGGKEAPTLTGTTAKFLSSITHLRLVSMKTFDGECFLKYRA